MGHYQTTYDAGIGVKKLDAAGNHDPADETSGTWDPATDPDTGHPSAADKPITERVDWEVPVAPEDPAMEAPPADVPLESGGLAADPPIGQTAIEGADA